MPKQTVRTKMEQICLALPDTKLTMTWGKPHFRVADKIFAGCGDHEDEAEIGFKLEMKHAAALIKKDARFSPAPYVGHKGWVSMDASGIRDWNEVKALILESYRLIAPKKSLAKLGGVEPQPPAKKRAKAKRQTALHASVARSAGESGLRS